MLAIFSGTQVGMNGDVSSRGGFISGLHAVFWFMAALMALATVLSYLRVDKRSQSAEASVRHR
jgi:hypothetical protein